MKLSRLPLLILTAAAVTACGDATAPELGARPASGPADHLTGSGHVDFGDGLREFTFHAKDNGDGTAKGSYKIELTALELFFEVDATCMSTSGDTAWVGGIISDTNAGFIQVGTVSYFYAIDNGEGAGAPPDVVSSARINDVEGEDLAFCRDQILLLPSFPIQYGNVQLR